MTRLMDQNHSYLSSFTGLQKQIARGSHPWLEQVRKEGIDRFAATGFPTNRQEEWRHTNVSALGKTNYRPAEPRPGLDPTAIAPFTFASDAAVELVFVNGYFSIELSSIAPLKRGVRVLSFEQALREVPDALEQHLSRYADSESNPFVALNTGFLRDGAFVHVPRGVALDQPIHLLFLSSADDQPSVTHPRVLIVAEDTAEVSVVETHAGMGAGRYFSNPVTEIVAGHGARIEHCKVQQESLEAFHVGSTSVRLGNASYFLSHSASLGSLVCRNDVNVVLGGTGGEAMLNGVTLIDGKQHVDNHTLLDHAEPRCPSHELYKAVLDGESSGVFKGKILVRADAQKTDSKQSSRTLLLSDCAVMHSQPALEIYADDVKCTHGSTTGPVDEQQIFYLRSRGVSLEAARHLLTYAFLAEVTGRIRVEPVRRRLEAIMAARHGLPQDLRVADLGLAEPK